MHRTIRSVCVRTAAIVAVMVIARLFPRDARACLVVNQRGAAADTLLSGEDVLIVWDENQHIEHFVRRVQFAPGAGKFVFIVPTPTEPQLGEADSSIFARLQEKLRSAQQPYISNSMDDSEGVKFLKGSATPGSVQILTQTKVAGFDATILKADSIDALSTWLTENNYQVTPVELDWLKLYVEKKWALTAFRFSDESSKTPFVSKTMRISFHTDKPFYPYREPSSAQYDPLRILNLFVISTSSVEVPSAWNNKIICELPGIELSDGKNLLTGVVPDAAAIEKPFLQAFVDRSPSRNGANDIFFEMRSQKKTNDFVCRQPEISPCKIGRVREGDREFIVDCNGHLTSIK